MENSLTYKEVKKKAESQGFTGKITELEDLLEPVDITFLWNQVNRLEDISELEILESYLDRQKELGAWVTELLPSPIEKIGGMSFTDNPKGRYDAMVSLSRQRDNNLKAVDSLGEFMTRKLIEIKPEGFFGEVLEGGSLKFFRTFQELENTDLKVPAPLKKKITSVHEKLNINHTGSC